MNAITTNASRSELIDVLRNSLYPGAKAESIELVLAYCRANGIDPMLKAVHIVPTRLKEDGKWISRDVLMPGIADYRIKAARSGEYGGKTEPEFGPDIERTFRVENDNGGVDQFRLTYPQWCRVTVHRIVAGEARPFPAKEFWTENYATVGRSDVPNTMWRKRPYGQLAKVAEAQALRMAFPEFSGGYTAEEMEGKNEFSGVTLDSSPAAPAPSAPALDAPRQPPVSTARVDRSAITDPRVWLRRLQADLAMCSTQEEVVEIGAAADVRLALEKAPSAARDEISAALANAFGRFQQPAAPDAPLEAPEADDGWPGPVVGEAAHA